jgi:membrane AbrB-like protein
MTSRKPIVWWGALLVLSLLLGYILFRFGVPASFLIGPMVVAIGFGVGGTGIRLPVHAFTGAQAIIGCLVAKTLSAAILVSLAHDWAPMLLVVAATVGSGAVAGWLLTRFANLPGSTAAWGSTPGAASVMVAMSADFGADMRLVAFLQYLRMVIVVLSASLVSHLIFGVIGSAAPAGPAPEGAAQIVPVIETLAIAFGGAVLAKLIRFPAAGILTPMIIAAALHISGLVEIALPFWLLAITYTVFGWYIGLNFNRDIFLYALRALPKLVLATLILIGLCAISAWVLTLLLSIDGLTAYLATSPGGLDSVVIIAVGSHADAPFVIAVQTLRLFAVMLTGPSIAKFLSRGA